MRIPASSKIDQLAEAQHLGRERVHLLLLDDARRGLADIAAGRTVEANTALAQRQRQLAPARQAKLRGEI